MSSESDNILSLAGLGRPFRLGMLYDCTKDQLIPGRTLWDISTLEKRVVQPNNSSDFKVITSDSLEDKASALNVNGNLKLSLLSGMLEVSGSGKYLSNEKSSNKHERVTVQYKCTTRSEQMTMDQLGPGKVQYPNVIKEETATHVVTEILYGAHAFFVFERDCSSSSHDEDIHGAMKVLLSKIPNMSVGLNLKGALSDKEINEVENFKCIFIGDFLLLENPCTYKDAVRVYKELPALLGDDKQNAIPIKVTLYPLTRLDSKASKLVREISESLTSKTEEIFEGLQELTLRCNDLVNSSVAKANKPMQKEIAKFKSQITIYKRELQKQLSVLLPRIRGGGVEESLLADLLNKNETSPFNYCELEAWVQDKENQVKILSDYNKLLAEIKLASDLGYLKSLIMNPENNNKYILCLRLLLPKSNFHLSKLETFNRNEYDYASDHTTTERNLEDNIASRNDQHQKISMMEQAILFKDYFVSNRESNETVFVVAMDCSDTLDYQANIECYRCGRLLNKDYLLPSAPGKPQVEQSTHNTATIHWTSPKFGASTVQKYEILCQRQTNRDNRPVSFTTGPDTLSFTVPELDVNSVYQVSVRSWCEVGVGPTSETNMVSIRPTNLP
ncbi:hypothetical protein OTU49_000101, partial [Cherax quadricarinatus]